MKRLFLLFLILAGLGVLALGVFLATFDANRYRPLLISKLEAALGRPVEIRSVSLRWHRGIALGLEGLKIRSAEGPALEAESAQALLNPWPLLRRQLQVTGISISGLRARVIRNPQGKMEVEGVAPPPAAGAAPAGPGSSAPSPAAPETLPLSVERIEVREGTLDFTDLSVTPPLNVTLQNLDLLARIHGDRLELTRLTGQVGGGTLSVRGMVSGFLKSPAAQIRFQTERLALDAVLPQSPPGQPRLHGQLFTTMDLKWTEGQILGQGPVRIEGVRLENLNVLREVFDRLTILPGLTDRLLERLPDSYRQRLLEKDTLFEPVEFRIVAKGEEVAWEELRIASELFEMRGSGRANLKGELLFPAQIRLEPALSGALIQSVEELRWLTDEEGRLTLPVQLQGTLPRVSVLPDVNYVAERLITSKGQELVEDLLQKVFKRK